MKPHITNDIKYSSDKSIQPIGVPGFSSRGCNHGRGVIARFGF